MRPVLLIAATMLAACPAPDDDAPSCSCDDDCTDQVCVDGVCTDGDEGTTCVADDDTTLDARDSDDAQRVDVSEFFCDCDDDCAPLGDGSVCNGTVCTFGVEGVPCAADPDATDASEVDPVDDVTTTDADGSGDVDGDTAGDAAGDAATSEDTGSGQHQAIDVWYVTSGGFSGMGDRDITVVAGEVLIDDPFGDDCRGPIDAGQMTALAAAASVIDWDLVQAEYRRPENPDCCCDQFVYSLQIAPAAGGIPSAPKSTGWCDETTESIPATVADFVGVLSAIADEVFLASCPAP